MLHRNAGLVRVTALGALAVLLAIAVAACGGGEEEKTPGRTPEASPAAGGTAAVTATTAAAPKYGGTLHVADVTDPLHVDAHRSGDSRALTYSSPVTNHLIRLGVEGKLLPDLADSWEQPDATTFVLHLHKGVRWQDVPPVNGREFTSADVKYNIERFTGSPITFIFADIFKGVLKTDGGIELPDDYTVKFNLTSPNVHFPYIVAHPALVMVAREQVEAAGDKKLTDSVIGTGPFILTKYSRAVGAEMKKNPNYWRKDAQGNAMPYLDGINIAIITDPTARTVAFKTKQLDTTTVEPTLLKDLTRDVPDAVVAEVSSGTPLAIRVKTYEKPFDDLRMRKVLQYATNRQEYIDTMYDGHASPLYGPIPALFGKWALPEADGAKYDLEKAKALMAEAGYAGGVKVKCMTTSAITSFADANVIMKQQLAKVGIDVDMEMVSWAEYVMRAYGGQGGHVIFAYYDLAHPSIDMYFRLRFRTDASGWSSHRWTNPKVDELIDKQREVTNEEERLEMVHEIQRLIVDEGPYVFILSTKGIYCRWPSVKNYEPRLFEVNLYGGSWQYESVWLEK